MQNDTPEARGCQAPAGKKELSSRPFYADGEKERLAARTALVEKAQDGLTTSDLNAIIKEVGGKPVISSISKVIEDCNQPNENSIKKKHIEESRKLLDTFSDKLKNYPKYLTYEGSVVLCVMVSINEGQDVSISGMPQVDRELILSQLPSDATTKMAKHEASLSVKFDDIKDFILTYGGNGTPLVKLNFFNAVIHPQKLPDTNVPIEQEGGKVMVGTAVVMDQKRIQKLIGVVPQEKKRDEEDEFPRRQPVAGRNAFELRADLVQMSVEWVRAKGGTEDDVIRIFKKFYACVENKR